MASSIGGSLSGGSNHSLLSGSGGSSHNSGGNGGSSEAFPYRLHRILDDAARENFEHIVSWIPGVASNNVFKVHDPKRFESEIMRKYFPNTKYKSFQRQLNMYGFDRISAAQINKSGSSIGSIRNNNQQQQPLPKGSYTHACFVRSRPELCKGMERIKIKGEALSKKKKKQRVSGGGSAVVVAKKQQHHQQPASLVAITDTDTSKECLTLTQHRIKELQRKKTEIEQNLSTISNQMRGDSGNRPSSDAMLLPQHQPPQAFYHRVSYNSNNADKKAETPSSQDEGIVAAAPMDVDAFSSSFLEEGDSLFFEGRTFHFVDQTNVGEQQQQGAQEQEQQLKVLPPRRVSGSGVEHRRQEEEQPPTQHNKKEGVGRRRSFGRRFSLELADPDSDKYILKELQEAIKLGTGMFANNQQEGPSPESLSSSSADFTGEAGSSESHRISLYDEAGRGSISHSRADEDAAKTDANQQPPGDNMMYHLNLDRPNRRFSLTSTSVHDPFEDNNLRELYNTIQQERQAKLNTAECVANALFALPFSSSSSVNPTTALTFGGGNAPVIAEKFE